MEEEVVLEVEAVQAVYGDDVVVLDSFPPHLHVQIKPRTADVSSQQFVEAVIGMKATSQYPDEPPHISIIDSKGLDERRQTYLTTCIREKASELTSCLMLVALCEEAVDQLTNMNHPDGDCPLCLNPLVDEDGGNNSLPFMKLMSCFHCFHCACIIRWWNWLQMERDRDSSSCTLSSTQNQKGMREVMEESMGTCPVCRKVFHAKDIEHVLHLVGTNSLLDATGIEADDDENILHSDSENIRRQKFESILKLQQKNSGLIEPKKSEVLLPGMYLQRSVASPPEVPNNGTVEQQRKESETVAQERKESETVAQERKESESNSVRNSRSSSNRPSSSKDRYTSTRKHGGYNARKQQTQWIRKENDMTR